MVLILVHSVMHEANVIPLVYVSVMLDGLALNVLLVRTPFISSSCMPYARQPLSFHLCGLCMCWYIEISEAGMTRGQLAGAVIGGLLVSFLIIGLIIGGMIYFDAFSSD